MTKLLNAFSLNMLASLNATIISKEISLDEAKDLSTAGFESAVGHPDTAAVFSEQLGMTVEVNRVTLALNKGDELLVGQYRGPRLPEGCKTLPEGATIQWCFVTIN